MHDEVRGYGGSPCYTSFNITVNGDTVICPGAQNERTVPKTATYTVMIPIPGSNCSISGSGGLGGIGGGGGGGSYGGGGGGQGGGGSWLPGAQPVIIGSETNQCGDSDLPRKDLGSGL